VVVNGYLTTVTGEYSGLWTHVELREAMKRGCEILDIQETFYFSRTITPLRDYMRDLYAKRSHAQGAGDLFEKVYKLFMNALSGKWGQRADNGLYEPVDVDSISDPEELEGVTTLCAGDLEYYVRSKLTHYRPDYVNVPWAAYMTAYARLHEISYLEEAFPDVYACDTDSVFTDYPFRQDDDLGGMGIKVSPRDWVFLYPKQYASYGANGEWGGKVKGVPVTDQDTFIRSGSYSWTKPATFKEALREGVVPGDWIERTRTDRDKYDKRAFLRDVDPFTESTDSRPFTYDEALDYYSFRPPMVGWREKGVIPRTRPYLVVKEQYDRERIRMEIEMLRESCLLHPRTMLEYWDYKHHKPRRVRDKSGNLTTWEYAQLDDDATELGFFSAEDLINAVRQQADTYRRIRELEDML